MISTQSLVADGTVHMSNQQYQKAVQCFSEGIKLDPHHVTAYMNLSNALRKMDKIDQSIQVLKNAINLNPNIPNLYSNLGCCYQKKLQFQNAVQCYNQALSFNKNLSDVQVRLGVIFRVVKKDASEALRHFENAIKLDNCNIQALKNASQIYLQLGNKEKAQNLNQMCLNQNCRLKKTVEICQKSQQN